MKKGQSAAAAQFSALDIRPMEGEKEFRAMIEFGARSFDLPEGMFAAMSKGAPNYVYGNTTTAWDGSRLVGSVSVFERNLAIGGCLVPAGGIADVMTEDDFRGKGLATALLGRAEDLMRSRGYVFSVLMTDIVPFYAKRGWSAIPRPRYVLDCAEVKPFVVPDRYTVEPLPPEDAVNILAGMYSDPAVTSHGGMVVRRGRYAETFFSWYQYRKPLGFAVRCGSDIVGACLVRVKGSRLEIDECGYVQSHPESPKNLLRAALDLANDRGCASVSGIFPETHPMAVKCVLLGGRREPDTMLMGKVLDTGGFADALAPLWAKRTFDAGVEKGRYTLQVAGSGTITAVWDGEKIVIADRAPKSGSPCAISHDEFVVRALGTSGFHGGAYTQLSPFWSAALQPQDGVFWDADKF